MKKELFDELLKSLRQAAAEGSDVKPSRVFVVNQKTEVANVRAQLGLSQSKFAAMLGISPSILKSWEQGRLPPTGAGKILIKLAKQDPTTLDSAA